MKNWVTLSLKALFMKEQQDYVRDIAEIRSMMERSSKFLSLSGWSGVMAGVYALAGVYLAGRLFSFDDLGIISLGGKPLDLKDSWAMSPWTVIVIPVVVLVLAVGTAIWLSAKKAKKRNEKLWNPVSKQLLVSMAVPLVTGALLMIILLRIWLFYFLPPGCLIFYGLALYNASRFTYKELKALGFIQITLGLISTYFIRYELLCWAFGFGVMHIVYGIYIHYKYER
jgi:hypothetical protein